MTMTSLFFRRCIQTSADEKHPDYRKQNLCCRTWPGSFHTSSARTIANTSVQKWHFFCFIVLKSSFIFLNSWFSVPAYLQDFTSLGLDIYVIAKNSGVVCPTTKMSQLLYKAMQIPISLSHCRFAGINIIIFISLAYHWLHSIINVGF